MAISTEWFAAALLTRLLDQPSFVQLRAEAYASGDEEGRQFDAFVRQMSVTIARQEIAQLVQSPTDDKQKY